MWTDLKEGKNSLSKLQAKSLAKEKDLGDLRVANDVKWRLWHSPPF